MAYELTGIFRYALKDLSVTNAYVLVHDGIAVTAANGQTLKKRDVLRLLNKCFYTDECPALASAFVYIRDSYTHTGNAHTNKAAKNAFNRDRYSFYPVCVHALSVKRFPASKPIAVDL